MQALGVWGFARHPRGLCAPPDLRKSDGCVPTTLTRRLKPVSQTAVLVHRLLWTLHGHLEESTWQAQLLAAHVQCWKALCQLRLIWMACTAIFFFFTIQIAVNSAGFCSHFPKLLEQQFLMPAQDLWMVPIKPSICMRDDGRFGTDITLYLHEVLLCLVKKKTLPLCHPSDEVSMLFGSLFKPSSASPGGQHQTDQSKEFLWMTFSCLVLIIIILSRTGWSGGQQQKQQQGERGKHSGSGCHPSSGNEKVARTKMIRPRDCKDEG